MLLWLLEVLTQQSDVLTQQLAVLTQQSEVLTQARYADSAARSADSAFRSADSATRSADSANSPLALLPGFGRLVKGADLGTVTRATPLHLGGQRAAGVHLLVCVGGVLDNRTLDLPYHTEHCRGGVNAGVTV